MKRRAHSNKGAGRLQLLLICLAGAGSAVGLSRAVEVPRSEGPTPVQAALRVPTGYAQLVSRRPLPEMAGSEQCLFVPAGAVPSAYAWTQRAESSGSSLTTTGTRDGDRVPQRVIRDTRPTFSAIAVDPVRDEIVVQDENLFQILVYDRLDNTPPQAPMTEPKRIIGGINTKVEFNCGLWVDPKSGDIYSVNNDSVETLTVFSRKAEGNVTPDRELTTPHGAYGIAVDEEHQELFLTVQHDNAVVVYRKTASGTEQPIRLLQGDRTRLADPHGIAVDLQRDLTFVANHGSFHDVSLEAGAFWGGPPPPTWPLERDFAIPGSGRLLPPSISVYSRTASGNTAPLRVISGPRTQLNWPAVIAVEPERGELFVANDGENSILVFRETDEGNAEPLRVIKGPKTGIKNPVGVSLDTRNNELWVANFGNHSVTVYPLTADGDTPPLRTIRSAPLGKVALGIGNPGAVAYDTKRKEILVPN